MKVYLQVVCCKQVEIDRFDSAHETNMEIFNDNQKTYRCVICDQSIPVGPAIAVNHRDLPGKAFIHTRCADETTQVLVQLDKLKRRGDDRHIRKMIEMKKEIDESMREDQYELPTSESDE